MANVGYATLSVIPSFQGFQSKLSAGTAGPLAAAGKQGGAKFGDAAGKEGASSFRSRFSGALKGFNPLAGLAIGAGAAALFKGAIDEASGLAESANKINVIFGDAAETVNDFADAASEGLGQSDLQARNAAASFGVYGKSAGLAGEELAGFSTELTALASDMASFYDSTVDEAIQAISSGLRGEAEPLRRFNVLLDDASLRQEALKQGIVETTKDALTPQQKILASHALIMEQTADVQGDFAKTQDGLANSSRDLSADLADMRGELGEKLLPAATAFVGFAKDEMVPAMYAVGGVVEDAASAFAEIPTPVKAAAGALVAFRAASSFGVTDAIGSGIASLGRGMEDVRLRTMLATDAFRTARAGVYEFQGNVGRVVAPVGRLSASMQGLSAAAAGAGSALRRGLSGAMGLLGGPWGVAFVGATAVVTSFWKQHQEAEQRVEDLTATLDKQTGALTQNSNEWAAKMLVESGAADMANELGISLGTVRDAALGDADAMERFRDSIWDARRAGEGGVATKLMGEVLELRDAVDSGTTEWQLYNDILGETGAAGDDAAGGIRNSADASDWAADAAKRYSSELDKTTDRLQDLIDKEQERADNAVSRRRDQLGLIQALQDTRAELNEGARTLNINTEAGQANREALYDLADQWNQSSEAVRGRRGAWRQMREDFIELATAMGAGDKQAERLAEQLLKMPAAKVDTSAIDKAKEKVAELEAMLDNLEQGRRINLGVPLAPGAMTARANGGPVNAGSPYLVGERGPEIIVPREGGTVLTARESATAAGGVTINIDKVIAPSGGSLMDQLRARSGGAIGGSRWN